MGKLKDLNSQIKELFVDDVKTVLNGVKNSTEEFSICISQAIDYIKHLGVIESEYGFEQNGWQYDFWKYMKYNGTDYCISGSGYYGKLVFQIVDEGD